MDIEGPPPLKMAQAITPMISEYLSSPFEASDVCTGASFIVKDFLIRKIFHSLLYLKRKR